MNYKITTPLSEESKQFDPPALFHTMVELHVTDFEKTKEFYTKLGFEVVYERIPDGFKGYLVLKLEKNLLCFWGGNENIYQQAYFSKFDKNTPKGYGVELVLLSAHLDDLYKKAQELNCVYEELRMRPWGVRDFRISDPWGFYLRFSDLHNILSNENAVV